MSRTKFSLDANVKSWVEWQLRHYRDYQRQLADYRAELMPSSTPAYGQGSGGHSDLSRPTESIAVKLTTAPHILYIETATAAIEKVLNGLDRTDRELVRLHYFSGTHTIEGAGQRVGLSKSPAYEHMNRILYALAVELGYISL